MWFIGEWWPEVLLKLYATWACSICCPLWSWQLIPLPTLSLLHPLYLKKIAAQLNKKKKERKRKSTIKSPYFSKFIREIIKFEMLFDIEVCLIHKFSLFAMLYLKVNCETKAFVVVVVVVKKTQIRMVSVRPRINIVDLGNLGDWAIILSFMYSKTQKK